MPKVKAVKQKKEKQKREKRSVTKPPRWFLTTFIVIGLTVLALLWALPQLPRKPTAQPEVDYQGIIELWNVESFEGGSGSRSSWLTNKSAKFESKHKGLFVHVTTLTMYELEQKLQDGQTFDMICFSRGAGNLVKDRLIPQTESVGFVRDNFMLSGQLDGKQYAVPLYAGAYCLFARAQQLNEEDLLSKALTQTYSRKIGKTTIELSPLVCGYTDFNSPLTALAMSGGRGNANSLDESVTQYQAYEQFVSNKSAVTLLGTQRDLFRLNQRESNGKIEQLSFAPLYGYTDLVQYVGVSSSACEKENACVEYIKYLLTEETQSALTDISMFSVLEKSIYTSNARYVACEQALTNAFVPNVFVDADVIAGQRQTARATLNI
ncbi:MAG: hypothetical protein NC099_03695 [Corallococcus sp.]|nr:hypothetical protein [Corallococcus sp.]